MGILLLILVVLIVWILVSCIKIVPQAKAMVVERLGAYQATWGKKGRFKRAGGRFCTSGCDYQG